MYSKAIFNKPGATMKFTTEPDDMGYEIDEE